MKTLNTVLCAALLLLTSARLTWADEAAPAPAPTQATEATPAGAEPAPAPQPVQAEPMPVPEPAPQQQEPAEVPPSPADEPVPAPMPAPQQEEPVPAPPVAPPAPPEVVPPAPPRPTPAPAPAAAQDEKFPTPAELFERIKKMREKEAAMPKVAHLDLAMPILEKPSSFSLFTDTTVYTLRAWVDRLHAARDDKDVRGVLITLGNGASLNLAQAQELREALVELRQAGKKTFVYADSYDTVGYTVASAATNVCLLEGGELMIPGVGLEATFYRGILDKVGVKADYIQVGEYKGADEQYTRTEGSPELREELNRLTDAMSEQLVNDISHHRNVAREQVKALIDETIISANVAKERGLVDHLVDLDGLRKLVGEEVGGEINLVRNYGMPRREGPDLSNPIGLLSSLMGPPPDQQQAPARQSVAVIYAEGVIVDGSGGDGIFSEEGIGSEDMRKALRVAGRDPNVKAIVIRIDSPGGSALASEAIWQAVRRLAGQKPVTISIGGMAASGGYYIASAGDHIIADPSAIIGSIGVVGGKFVMKDLYDKLGIRTETFNRGRNAGLFSSSAPFDERQRRMLTNWMKGTYEQFTKRVMVTRNGKISDIDKVARGRIFIAKQAKDLGMIDEIGGVQTAIAHAAGKAGMQKGSYDVRVLPQPRTLVEMLSGAGMTPEAAIDPETLTKLLQPTVRISEDSVLRLLAPSARKSLLRQVQFMQVLQDRPVVLVSPYVITVR